ncbi:MAG: riboflavin synthase [Deltaproteobacteria bacterium]|nr:MAG: riboflavin synthase [Deltaproteobacteria bacterium]
MFTGIIEGFGTIREIRPQGQGRRLVIESDFILDETRIGDSIAVNGACLTAVLIDGTRFAVDVAPETLALSTLDAARPGERVNLERALKVTGRLDGHLVSGHIDGTGVIRSRERLSNAIIISFAVDPGMMRYMIHKGSIAVDGTSLTINHVGTDSFTVSIIPHTAALSTVGMKKIGDRVNIETDLVGKYIERFLLVDRNTAGGEGKTASIDVGFLAKNGFL